MQQPLGIRPKVFFVTFVVTFFVILVSVGYLSRDTDALLPSNAVEQYHARVPFVAGLLALLSAGILAITAGTWMARDRAAVQGELTRANVLLRGERDVLTRILDGMQEGVLLVDSVGVILRANPALRRMLLLGHDVTGKLSSEVLAQKELRGLFERARRDSLASEEVLVGELSPRRLFVRVTARDGALLGVFVDVTDVRRLETLRRDFVANVSHELRTPVTSVLSAAETLRGSASKDPVAMLKFIGIIERNAGRLERLIEDLLDLSRIESQKYNLAAEDISMRAFGTNVLAMFRERAETRKFTLVNDIGADVTSWADKRALEQILVNLVDNAVKYGPEGTTVSLRASLVGDLTRVVVEDTGLGIEEKHLPRLFERFYRVDTGRSRELGGTGLGLSIVKHLAEAMGGDVTVESAVGKGTKFIVMLPATEAAATPAPSADLSDGPLAAARAVSEPPASVKTDDEAEPTHSA
jgi:two-component system phosphate regulon sensor histidine kinase PhoR